MIDKVSKRKYLERIQNKDEKFFVASVLDKASKFERENSFEITGFMDLNELKLAREALGHFNISYIVKGVNDELDKKNILFIPDYMEGVEDDVYADNVVCIKIIPESKDKLTHRDFMGAIYNLSVEREYLGDIIVKDNIAYFFTMKSFEKYFIENIVYVGKSPVETKVIDIYSQEIESLSQNYKEKDYIVPSMRVDAILSEVYALSRSQTKDKIEKGHLFINDKEQYFPSTPLECGDIVSFRQCGKFKVGEQVRTTKSGNIVLHIKQYA